MPLRALATVQEGPEKPGNDRPPPPTLPPGTPSVDLYFAVPIPFLIVFVFLLFKTCLLVDPKCCVPHNTQFDRCYLLGCIQASQGLLPFTGRCHPRVSNLPGYLLGQQGRPCRHGWRCRRARRFRRVWLCPPLEPRHRGRLLRGICEGGRFLPSDGVRGTSRYSIYSTVNMFGQLCWRSW